MYDVKAFWQRLKKVLKSKNITMVNLSTTLGYSEKTYSVKQTNNVLPTTADIIRICELLNVSADFLLFGKKSTTDIEFSALPEDVKIKVMELIKTLKD